MKFHRTVAKAAQKKERTIKIEIAEGTRRLRLPALIYVEVLSHYLYFHTTKRDYRSRGNISEIEKELEKYNFVRITSLLYCEPEICKQGAEQRGNRGRACPSGKPEL